MRKYLLLTPTLVFCACATTGSTGSKGSSAPFQGVDAVQKRRVEISDAASKVMDCMKVKAGEQPAQGGIFAASADASGKLTITPIKWPGSDAMKQCIIDKGQAVQLTALPGPSVGTLWEFLRPGEKSEAQNPPEELRVKMQPLQETMQTQVIDCGQRFLGVDFGATIEIAYYLYNNGQAYAPTVVSSDAKDGSFDSCVQDVVARTKYPTVDVAKPFGTTAHFKIGQYGQNQRRND
jgi:hypothetical protein